MRPMIALVLGLLLSGSSVNAQSNETLDIYWIDVEGGAATLIVTPARESILMDAGWNQAVYAEYRRTRGFSAPRGGEERDAKRIQAAMRDASITEIDYFIASHFHSDHMGGVPALAARVPIKQFVDHGDSVEQGRAWESYLSAAKDKRRIIKPGDTLPLAGIEFLFVTSAESVLSRAGRERPNPNCQGASAGNTPSGENSHSVGYLMSLGGFEFLNLGDLTVNIQHKLACPQIPLATIDLFQVPHHGNGVAPQLTRALNPTVAVLNNGPNKGGGAEGFDVVQNTPGVEAIWQVHRPLNTDEGHHATEQMTANTTDEPECLGYWIKATVQPDGSSYSLTNGRNQFTKTYVTK